MRKITSPGFPFVTQMQAIRTVRWEHIPLGCVILEWTEIHGASIPELLEYPLITERLRSGLWNRYQFLRSTKVTIADPSGGIGRERIIKASRDTQILKNIIPEVERFHQGLRQRWMNEPDVRQGLGQIGGYDKSPFTLTKDWTRSIGTVVKENACFGSTILGPDMEQESVGSMMAKLLTDGVRLPDPNESVVHLGLDISFSMTGSGKSRFFYNNLLEILLVTAEKLKTSTWHFWLLSDGITAGDWRFPLKKAEDLDRMLEQRKAVSGNTNFAPFYRRVLEMKKNFRYNLCILLTDGICQDRPAALRTAEKLAEEGIDYLQVIIHQDEEHRTGIITDHPDDSTDGVIPEELITESDTRFTRTDGELRAYCDDRLREITDIAEAARGGQLILTWYPFFSYLAMDVYGRYLGMISTNHTKL